ncbi:hypothetical protein B566_EDAN013080 [Ephemera danica]|nr:hypothetical protein B566_EDAN013080 [Ephemera danica]
MVKIVFLHPDLGIGGAERLVVDAGLAFKQKGHDVHFITSHHDPSHCFSETRDGTLPVTVVGDWLPRSVFGHFYALCAYARMIYAAIYLVFISNLSPDVIFCDQISACIPVLKFGHANILFYCHFPDQLLSIPGGWLKKLYRAPINWLEQTTTGQADVVFVNSQFTSQIFRDTFPRLKHVNTKVLYPSLNTDNFDKNLNTNLNDIIGRNLPDDAFVFLSINRYERKKNLGLALQALRELRGLLTDMEWFKVYLVMAGGYDSRVAENREHYEELSLLVQSLKLGDKVCLLKSPSDDAKLALLKACSCLVYTPANEHFGIVPLEAMYVGRPVIAVNSGGPTETVVHEVTGLLCPPSAPSFGAAMAQCFRGDAKKMQGACRERIKKHFSFQAFAQQLDSCISHVREKQS